MLSDYETRRRAQVITKWMLGISGVAFLLGLVYSTGASDIQALGIGVAALSVPSLVFWYLVSYVVSVRGMVACPMCGAACRASTCPDCGHRVDDQLSDEDQAARI